MLYKADTPRLRSTMQNICFLISISAVTLKLINNGQNHIHFWFIQVLKNSMTWNLRTFRPFRSLSSKLEFVYSVFPRYLEKSKRKCSSSRQSNPKVNHGTHLKDSCKTSNGDVKHLPQRKLWVWAANNARSHKNLIKQELRGACASSETMDLRTLEFRLTSTRCPSATSERVTNLHILVPAIPALEFAFVFAVSLLQFSICGSSIL